uniref:Uncharacterized protein LOC105125085 n=2 Tax=Rhizophora mucronata TaxID=61149 RepID=A0A2P2KP83_RHIMU
MGRASLSINLAVVLSLSLAVSASSSSHLFFKPPSSPPPPKATPSDLLALLGPTNQSSKIDPLVSQQLRSCLKFLVPFKPKPLRNDRYNSQKLISKQQKRTINVNVRRRIADSENELVWWPPEPVLDLARLAVDSGGDPDAIHRALDPTVLSVPDVERCKENRCELTRTPYGRRFISEELNSYLEFLFELIVARGPAIGFDVSLNRYDFFHGHLFLAIGTGRLGIL